MTKDINKRVLIVEDEQSLRDALQIKLKEEGYDVATAGDGKQAMDLLKKQKFDLMLLDILMPVMDGFSTLEAMKAEGIKVTTAVLSNISEGEEKHRAKELGAADYIIKSTETLADLVEYVKKHT